jgi:hypothetical protein
MAVALPFGNARGAAIEQIERFLDRLAHRTFSRWSDVLAPLESLVDRLGKFGMRHRRKPPRNSRKPAAALSGMGREESSVALAQRRAVTDALLDRQ